MKNKILLFATFVLVSLGALATTNTTTINRYYNDYGNSFTFVERGVTFAVFQNGEFDFYRNGRNGMQVGYSSSNVNISFNSGYDYDAYVQYDDYGAIIQVEDIPIYYDYYGRVNRIGNININYNHGRLISVGGLYVHYNNYGHYSHYSGFINIHNRHYVYHPYHNFFIRPLFDFRIVSYKPYRHYYSPVRYRYHRDHSRNKYYSNNRKHYKYGKRDGRSTRHRVATHKIPKRRDNSVARNDRNNVRYNATSKNTRGNVGNSTTRRNSAEKRDVRNTRTATDRIRSTTTRSPRTIEKNRSVINRKPVNIDRKRSSVTNRKVVANQNRSKNVYTRKPVRVKEKRSTTNNRKSVTTQSRSKTVNSRKPVNKQVRKSSVRTTNRKPVKKASSRSDYSKRRKG